MTMISNRESRDFEQAWRLDGPREISDFLDRSARAREAERARLLVELICIDMEFRWRNAVDGSRAGAAGDLRRGIPSSARSTDAARRSSAQEYRVRSQWGDRPSHAEFLSRFRARREQIRAELCGSIASSRTSRPTLVPPRRPGRGSHPGDRLRLIPVTSPALTSRLPAARMIGAGRMGKVYEATADSRAATVAVKFLRKSFLRHPGGRPAIHRGGRGPSPGCVIPTSSGPRDSVAPPAARTSSSWSSSRVRTWIGSPERTVPVGRGRPLDDRDLQGARTRPRAGHRPLRPQARESLAGRRREAPGHGLRPRPLPRRGTRLDGRDRGDRAVHGPGTGVPMLGTDRSCGRTSTASGRSCSRS